MVNNTHLDRRTFVRLAGGASVAAAAGCSTTESTPDDDETGGKTEYGFFDAEQAATVEIVVDRLLPEDEDRPAASDIGVVRYIDRALQREPFYETAHDDRRFQDAYESGIGRLDETAQELFNTPVRELSDDRVDELLSGILGRSAPGWEDIPTANAVSMTVPAEAFVTVLRDHAIEGYYSQPKYGGNIDLDGWKQAGYVGPFLEGYLPDELKPPWKSFEDHEQQKTRPTDLYGEFGGEEDA